MTGTAVWMYAVVPAGHPDPPPDIEGVAGGPVRVVSGDWLAAVVGDVPLSDFSEDALREHLEELPWLERAARAHHRVIDETGRRGDVVPLRFATIYHDDESVRTALTERSADFRTALDRIAGRHEWGVKAYVDPHTLRAAASPAPSRGAGGDRPGTAYLLQRKAQHSQREQSWQTAMRWASEIRETVGAASVALVRHPPQDARLAGFEGWMILNDSYLVDESRSKEFADLYAACEARFPDVRLEISGPWPAYSFTADDPRPTEEASPPRPTEEASPPRE